MHALSRTVAGFSLLLSAVVPHAGEAVHHKLSERYAVGDDFMSVGLRGALHLPYTTLNELPMVELSGLAWDEDEQLLHALSDHGRVFSFRPVFEDGYLVNVELVRAFALLDDKGKPLQGVHADAEGLAAVKQNNGRLGDTELVVSFERRPRVIKFDMHGLQRERLPLPDILLTTYHNSNKGLESVTRLSQGDILTAPEWPLPEHSANSTWIYALDGRRWAFPRFPAPRSSLVAIESMPDGSLLTLERSFVSIWRPLQIALRQTTPLLPAGEPLAIAREFAVFNSFEGWQIDNFEGLTRHGPTHLFLVSDDNESWPQKTLLIYLELLDEAATHTPTERLR